MRRINPRATEWAYTYTYHDDEEKFLSMRSHRPSLVQGVGSYAGDPTTRLVTYPNVDPGTRVEIAQDEPAPTGRCRHSRRSIGGPVYSLPVEFEVALAHRTAPATLVRLRVLVGCIGSQPPP